jgi:cytochrome d ubiquinol oxidase subunit II
VNISLVVLCGAVALGAIFAAAFATRGRQDGRPFDFAEVALLATALGLLGTVAPYMVPPSMTFWEALAPNSTVTFLLILVGACMPIVLVYNAYAYHVFRGKFVVPVPARLAAMATRPRPTSTSYLRPQASLENVPSTPTNARPLEWLRNLAWIAVWSVLFFLCIDSLGGVLGDRGDLLGVVLLIVAMVAVWFITSRRDGEKRTPSSRAGWVDAE